MRRASATLVRSFAALAVGAGVVRRRRRQRRVRGRRRQLGARLRVRSRPRHLPRRPDLRRPDPPVRHLVHGHRLQERHVRPELAGLRRRRLRRAPRDRPHGHRLVDDGHLRRGRHEAPARHEPAAGQQHDGDDRPVSHPGLPLQRRRGVRQPDSAPTRSPSHRPCTPPPATRASARRAAAPRPTATPTRCVSPPGRAAATASTPRGSAATRAPARAWAAPRARRVATAPRRSATRAPASASTRAALRWARAPSAAAARCASSQTSPALRASTRTTRRSARRRRGQQVGRQHLLRQHRLPVRSVRRRPRGPEQHLPRPLPQRRRLQLGRELHVRPAAGADETPAPIVASCFSGGGQPARRVELQPHQRHVPGLLRPRHHEVCTDVCFANTDCTAVTGWRCRPETVAVSGGGSYSVLCCGP